MELIAVDSPEAGWRRNEVGVTYWLPEDVEVTSLSEMYLENVVYITHGADKESGGTGFLLGFEYDLDPMFIPTQVVTLVVTNRHVLPEHGPVRVHFNERGGGKRYVEIDRKKWRDAPKDDLAVAVLEVVLDVRALKHRYLPVDALLEERELQRDIPQYSGSPWSIVDVGIGCEVFCVGRLSAYEGTSRAIRPVLRMGNVSMLPESLGIKRLNFRQLCFFVEMRSVSGFSGSPVFVINRQSTTSLARTFNVLPVLPQLLGVEVANVEPECPVYRLDSKGNPHPTGEMVQANAGQTAVIPAWRLRAFVCSSKVQEMVEKQLMAHREKDRKNPLRLS